MAAYGKFLIIKPSSLGDVVHSLTFLAAFKKTYPEALVHWVIAGGLEGLLEGHPLIDRLWVIHKDRWKGITGIPRMAAELSRLGRSLRKEHYEAAVDLQGLLRSGIISRLAGCRRTIGFSEAREGSRHLYSETVSGGRDVHAVVRYLRVARYLGCADGPAEFPLPPLPAHHQVSRRFSLPGAYSVLVPGARWLTKRWPADRFGMLAARLPLPALVVGSSADEEISHVVVRHANGRARSLSGLTSLQETMAVIGGASVVVTNDTGPMHIAAALRVPVVALFGPTDPRKTGPYGEGHSIISAAAPCAPCFKKHCNVPYCMHSITVEEVYRATQERIGRNRTQQE